MGDESTPRISETEWKIMRVVWALAEPATAGEILHHLQAEEPGWHPKTTRTLLARLVEKKALRYEARGRSYAYTPLVSEEECVAAASGSFLERVFGGSLKPMLVHFIEQRRLSRDDVDELRALLDQTTEAPTTPDAEGGDDHDQS